MSWRTFNTIIWFGKPASIALYSLGLSAAFQWLSAIV